MIKKIISGGQTGADRAGLDAAIAAGLPHGGWCLRGRKASDGPIPERYKLKETEEDTYPPRTENNVVDGDGTVIFCSSKKMSRGCALTRRLCIKHDKPYKLVDVDILRCEVAQDNTQTIQALREWIEEEGIKTLNVAGSRESKSPGIYFLTYETILALCTEE